VHLVVYSDYLCPWCYNVAVRLERLEQDLGGAISIDWRSYLLRPRPAEHRDLERFREYTRSWLRPAAEADSGTFRPWKGNAGPPTWSVPPHRVAKAAGALGEAAFRRVHAGLLRAYFFENRDVTDPDTLRAVWREAELPDAEFARSEDPALVERILDEHNEAISMGVTGVPAVRMADDDVAIVGAHPVSLYRRWIDRRRADSSAA